MRSGETSSGKAAVQNKCPICGQPERHETRPFCSRRCADIDLGRWLGGGYVIAAAGAPEDEDGAPERIRSEVDATPESDDTQ